MNLTRRELIKWIGAGSAAAALAGISAPFLKGRALAGTPAPTLTPAAGAPRPTKRLRRWSMVIDLKRCDGCIGVNLPPQCTTACIQGHYVPAGMQWIQVFEYPLEQGGSYFLPAPCMQCDSAPCVNVCPVGATFTTPEGLVLIDQERCIGCRLCMAACPYDRRFFNWGEPVQPPQAKLAKYSPEHQVPAIKGTPMKCDFCPDMARDGNLPYCVSACPRRAMWYGDLEEDIATDTKQVVKLSKLLAENDAFRLKEDLGTKPKVYYLPGYGQDVGRSPFKTGLLPVSWPWGDTK